MRVVAGSGLCRRWLEVGWILADLDTSMILIWTDIKAANDPSVSTIMEKAPNSAFSWLKALVGTFNQEGPFR